jgi:ATP-dependent RNA helicase RhlE
VPREIVAGFEPNPDERAEPIQRGRGGQQRAPQRQAPKREGSDQRRGGQPGARKAPARAPHADRSAPPARGEAKNAPRPASARPAEPPRARPAPTAAARRPDASSTVRTNIPGLAPPGHRRGR